MSLLVTGSIGIDTVIAPAGRAEDILGGSAVYFAAAASFFGPVRFVAAAGEDLPEGFLAPLERNANVDLSGLEVRKGSRTFRWTGRYHDDVNERDTLDTQLGVLGEAGPKIPQRFRDSRFVFLANSHPALQGELLDQLDGPTLVVADTMNLWIEHERAALDRLVRRLDGLVLNDGEAKLLTGRANVVTAGLELMETVRRFLVIKKGEHGSLLFTGGKVYALPAYPAHQVVDPTGAGDSFAGAMMGHLAAANAFDAVALRRALAYGTVTASLELEDFSLNRLMTVTREEIDQRYAEYVSMVSLG